VTKCLEFNSYLIFVLPICRTVVGRLWRTNHSSPLLGNRLSLFWRNTLNSHRLETQGSMSCCPCPQWRSLGMGISARYECSHDCSKVISVAAR
jgi:hypothetical protein